MTHRFETEVFYEDTDMGGIVYHANYLKFIERARSAWVRSLGIDQLAMRDQGTLFVVRSMTCDFKAPARFEDRLTVQSQPQDVSGARLILRQEVLREAVSLFSADVTLVCLTSSGRPTRLPGVLRSVMQA
ncbi:MAG: tol-pal system-associated acyl-CoA thioesterase [Pseudomonadota bacterium]